MAPMTASSFIVRLFVATFLSVTLIGCRNTQAPTAPGPTQAPARPSVPEWYGGWQVDTTVLSGNPQGCTWHTVTGMSSREWWQFTGAEVRLSVVSGEFADFNYTGSIEGQAFTFAIDWTPAPEGVACWWAGAEIVGTFSDDYHAFNATLTDRYTTSSGPGFKVTKLEGLRLR